MKKNLRYYVACCITLGSIFTSPLHAQHGWPREIPILTNGSITIYTPQPESFHGNKLSARAAVSVKASKDAEPVFGAIWMEASTQTNRETRMVSVESIDVKQVKFPGQTDSAKIEKFSQLLETEMPKWNLTVSMETLTTALEKEGIKASTDLKTDPPKIIYSNKVSVLVLIDGEPKLEKDKNMGLEKVVNSPFPIVKEGSNYYLLVSSFWYVSTNIKTGWKYTTQLPSKLTQLNKEIEKQRKEQEASNKSVALAAKEAKPAEEVVVSTEPAELIQTDGNPEYKSITGTSLLFITNSPNDVFKDINSQKTYVLFAGRWYSASSLKGPWAYVPADKLPADFAAIREGSDKDNVLASVAGTNAANEAVLDAMIPQTATVNRSTAKPSEDVKYDGTPQFERIQGTNLELAVNTKSTVLRQNGIYYIVDNGIWFESTSANGPWRVSTKRPTDVDNIPASSPAYNTKYVEVYDVQPDVVVVGYTPGYMGSYVYGPTVVYGTGYPYNPWYGPYYYPRPVTYGFGMSYNPWTGWSVNFGMSWGPWHFGVSSGGGMYFGFGFGGWCGPPVYRPPYRPPYWGGGYYGGGNHWGNNNINIGGGNTINIGEINIGNGNNNIYNKRGPGVNTRDIQRQPGMSAGGANAGARPSAKPATRPSTSPSTRPATQPGAGNQKQGAGNTKLPNAPSSLDRSGPRDVYTDKSGNVYKRDTDGNWNQNNKGNNWQPANNNGTRDLDRMQQQRDRSRSRDNSFQSNKSMQSRPATMNRGGGGARPAGGAGMRRR